jgi:signal peptidase II
MPPGWVLSLRSRWPYLALSLLVLALDRWSKVRVQEAFTQGSVRTVIDGFFQLTYFQNTGVAFGLLSGSDSQLKWVLLSGFAAIAACAVVVYSLLTPPGERGTQSALALILAGALGNFYDRLTVGYVTDFLYFHLGSHYWPAFNVADSAISVGVGLIALGMIRHDLRDRS